MPSLLVTGGTGTLGRAMVERALAEGHRVRVLSRRASPPFRPHVEWVSGDLRTGPGLVSAVTGVQTVIHCATDVRAPRRDIEATTRLIEVMRASGGAHLVYVSIVGVDRVPLPYYRVKLEAERLVEASGLPWSILRATQFHDLLRALLRTLARLPVMPIPAQTSFQPVDVRDVAERLVHLSGARPVGRAPDFGGPQVHAFAALARMYLRAAGRHRPLLPVWLPGTIARGYREGGHLTPDHADGRRSFAAFLVETSPTP